MCNIAGYLGPRKAAPVLLDMLEKQEGWGGGFYSGIATVHDGMIHMRKVVGDVARLRRLTDAVNLPGTVGIAHSRSRSGGDREWGHPFMTEDGGQAYVANGSRGVYRDDALGQAVADRLEGSGYTFRSSVDGKVGQYSQLADGRSIHFSDLMCGLIDAETRRTGRVIDGFARAYGQFPGEIVGLVLRTDDPDAITAGRINMPMMLGRTAESVYLATTALAFPDEADLLSLHPLSINSATRITLTGSECVPLDPVPAPVADLFPWDDAVSAIMDVLQDGAAHSLGQLTNVTRGLWPEGMASQNAMLVYELLRRWIRQGRARVVVKAVEGAEEALSAPRFCARLTRG